MRIERLLLSFILLALAAAPAAAQDEPPEFEFFGGYSYLRADTEDVDDPFNDFKNIVDGFNVAATGYATRRLGLTGDFSGHFRTVGQDFAFGRLTAKTRTLNFLAGPQVRFPNQTRATPFLRALAGVANNHLSIEAPAPVGSESIGLTDFALAIGGGLDVRVGDRVSLRVFQIDYNPVFVRNRPDRGIDSTRLDNFRISVGVVFN